MSKKLKCEVCGSPDIETIYILLRIPAFQNKLFPTPESAKKTQVAEVDLAACPVCGFVFNALFDDSVMEYGDDYQNAQDHSPNFKSYLEEIADLFLKRCHPGEKIVEIGCGKGFFLNILKSRGVDVTGFDPAYEGDDPAIVKAYFDADTAGNVDAASVVMRHSLEHIESPYKFLLGLKQILKPETKLFLEIPRFGWIVDHKAFWDIFHEHCNYFSEGFFQGIFAGKAEIIKTFDDQYMVICATLGDLVPKPVPQNNPRFSDLFSSEITKYAAMLRAQGTSYVWGAGAKGIAFVNILDPDAACIKGIVDINPKKQGYFAPLTGHPCIAPTAVDWSSLKENDCLWIMNARYKNEILESLPQLKCRVVALG